MFLAWFGDWNGLIFLAGSSIITGGSVSLTSWPSTYSLLSVGVTRFFFGVSRLSISVSNLLNKKLLRRYGLLASFLAEVIVSLLL